MAIIQSLLIKDKPYEKNRLTIVGSQSGDEYFYYSESRGTRHYVNQLSSTASAGLESVSFNAYLSFTSSGTQSWDFELVPMSLGESCIVETRAYALNADGSKGYVMKSFGGFRHNGSELQILGNSFDYDIKTDMYGADIEFYANGTASVNMEVTGENGETLDWDIYIIYSKGYHSLTFGGSGDRGPWYPPSPPKETA